MSFGKMRTFIDIVTREIVKDEESFSEETDRILASVTAYKEERFGSKTWANRAAFSEANALFRFRNIPDLTIKPKMFIVCDDGRYEVVSVDNVKDEKYFSEETDRNLASEKVYKEERIDSKTWENRADFSEENELFRYRNIPDLTIKPKMFIVYDDGRYEVVSVDNVKNRNMYIEVLTKKVVASDG